MADFIGSNFSNYFKNIKSLPVGSAFIISLSVIETPIAENENSSLLNMVVGIIRENSRFPEKVNVCVAFNAYEPLEKTLQSLDTLIAMARKEFTNG